MSHYWKSLFAILGKNAVGIGLMCGMLMLSGCSAGRYFLEYRPNIQQGNVVDQKNIAQLKPGMTRDQVRYVLGTPLLQDPFHSSRWDYVYRFEDGATGQITMRNIFVQFNSAGILERVGGDVAAKEPSPDAQISGDLTADANAAADAVAATRPNTPQVIDLGSLPENAEGPPEDAEPPSDSWYWRLIHPFK